MEPVQTIEKVLIALHGRAWLNAAWHSWHSIAHHCPAWLALAWHCIAWHGSQPLAQLNIAWLSMIQLSMTMHSLAQVDTMAHGTAQTCTAWCFAAGFGSAQLSMAVSSTLLCMAQCCIALLDLAQLGTAWHCLAQHSSVA